MASMRYLIDLLEQLNEKHGVHYGASFHLFEKDIPAKGFKNLLAEPDANPKLAKVARLSKADANPKLAKSGKHGILAVPLHLAPAKRSGFNVCPCSTAGCRAACLHTAGNPLHMRGKDAARIARTHAYFNDRKGFLADLVREVAAHQRRADRTNMVAAVRLNATSDIAWETQSVEYQDKKCPNIMACFPDVQFYDYTKVAKRAIASITDSRWPANYHVTFSLSEHNDAEAAKVLEAGGNVAVVFHLRPSQPMPEQYTIHGVTRPVINGEEHDARMMDEKNVIVGLRAKGMAKHDTSGFVRDPIAF